MNIEIGLKGSEEHIVRPEDTAKSFDSGGLDILATPMLICNAEKCCKNMVQPLLEDGMSTVGTLVNIHHLAPTPVGMKYRCECEVIAAEKRMIRFHVIVRDEIDTIGEGIHERFIINDEHFHEKAYHKLTLSKEKQD